MIERRFLRSRILGEERSYRILVPPGYEESGAQRYPTLYLHDGQAIFSDDTEVMSSLLDGDRWPALDRDGESIRCLIENRRVRPFITVAVDALDLRTRMRDYLAPGDRYLGVDGRADLYTCFVLDEVKPAVDSEYRTLTGRDDTATAGFSFGGRRRVLSRMARPRALRRHRFSVGRILGFRRARAGRCRAAIGVSHLYRLRRRQLRGQSRIARRAACPRLRRRPESVLLAPARPRPSPWRLRGRVRFAAPILVAAALIGGRRGGPRPSAARTRFEPFSPLRAQNVGVAILLSHGFSQIVPSDACSPSRQRAAEDGPAP